MSDSRHARVKEIFLAACELEDGERERFVDEACGDDAALRGEVASLLDFHAQDEPAPSAVPRGEVRFEPGHVFAGRYRIVAELGRGGMGQVFRADDLVLDAPVALKFLPPGSVRSASLVNEVRLARQVTHPNVCRVFDFGEAEGEVFLTMEYVDGEDLGALLKRIGRLPEDKLLELALELCDALGAAHAQGVLHRDLKPANILIDGRGRARITDFGIATMADTPRAGGGAPAGTPAYMAPEQWSRGEITVRSDLYALGMVLYEMAAGRPAFHGTTPAEYAELHREATPVPPSARLEHLDPALESVILRCLEKDPNDRPASAQEVAAALPGGDRLERLVAAGETPSPEMVAQAGRPEILGPGRAAVLAAALLAVLVTVFVLDDRVHPARRPLGETAPAVLAARAAETLEQLGHTLPAGDRAWGYWPDLAAEGDVYLFWYRQSLDPMVPAAMGPQVDTVRVGYYDPSPIEMGDVQMLLDAAGRLVVLRVRLTAPDGTPLGEDEGGLEPATPAAEVDWDPVLAAAGLRGATLEPTAPHLWPPVYADRRVAWTTADPRRPGARLRIEAAALGGRLVFFDQRGAEDEPGPFFGVAEEAYFVALGLLTALLTVGVVLVARTNLRRGRGDLRGALRLALAVAAVNLLRWLLSTDHVPSLDAESELFLAGLGRVLVEALTVWLAYIALEPLVRRYWPQTLIVWSRLQRGRTRDPLVGHSLLAGTFIGVFWVLLTGLDRLAVEALGLEAPGDFFLEGQLEMALSVRRVLAGLLSIGVEAVYWGLLHLFLLVALFFVLRRRSWAVAGFVLLVGTIETLSGYHPAVSWLTLGVGVAVPSAVLLGRLGLLSYITALFAYDALLSVPLTLDVSAWFAESGYWTLLALAVLGGYGCWAAAAPKGRTPNRAGSGRRQPDLRTVPAPRAVKP